MGSNICWIKCQQPAPSTWEPRKQHPVSSRCTGMSSRLKPLRKTLDSIMRHLLQLPSHQAAAPSGHLSSPPLLLRRHPCLNHLLLCHHLVLHPLQPPWLPHPFRPLSRPGHLSPGPPPTPALPPQAPRARLAPCQSCQLGPKNQQSQCRLDSPSPPGSPTTTVKTPEK